MNQAGLAGGAAFLRSILMTYCMIGSDPAARRCMFVDWAVREDGVATHCDPYVAEA